MSILRSLLLILFVSLSCAKTLNAETPPSSGQPTPAASSAIADTTVQGLPVRNEQLNEQLRQDVANTKALAAKLADRIENIEKTTLWQADTVKKETDEAIQRAKDILADAKSSNIRSADLVLTWVLVLLGFMTIFLVLAFAIAFYNHKEDRATAKEDISSIRDAKNEAHEIVNRADRELEQQKQRSERFEEMRFRGKESEPDSDFKIQNKAAEAFLSNKFSNDETLGVIFALGVKMRKKENWSGARLVFSEYLKHKPNDADALIHLCHVLNSLAEVTKDIDERKKLNNKAIKKCKKAIDINPKNDWAWNYWGRALNSLAEVTKDIEKDIDETRRLLNEAIEKCKKATDINPKNDWAWSNWGEALGYLAETTSDIDIDERKRLLYESIEKYEKATVITQKNEMALSNWGWALTNLAKVIKDNAEEKNRLLNEAIVKFEESVKVGNATYTQYSYMNWGCALAMQVDVAETSIERNNLRTQAQKKFQVAIEFEHSHASCYVQALSDYYNFLQEWIKDPATSEADKSRLILEALEVGEKLKRAKELEHQ